MKFFIDQHGCAKNQVDGELMISILSKKGYEQTFKAEEADLIIVNSCGFIESAKMESITAVQSARQMYPKAKILLAGCLAERYAKDLKDSLTEADGFFGNGDLDQLYKVVEPMMKGERPVLTPPQKGISNGEREMLLSFSGSAFVKITEGCNNRCTYCAIPVIRGELRSRKADEIIEEIKKLVSEGVYEINLIGQDLAAYGTGRDDNVFGTGRTYLPKGTPGFIGLADDENNKESGLCTLLKIISKIEGTFAVRLLYIHPDHFNEDIIPIIKSDKRILPYFDLPLQSGDDKIIKMMRRVGTAEKYKALIQKIREALPEAAIRTTFLAGFPGETDEQAENSRKFLEEIRTDWSGCFPYSVEEDTPAERLPNQVEEKVKEERANALIELQAKITRERLAKRCGKDYDVLIEEVLAENPEAKDEGIAIGRAWFQAPEVDGSVVVNYDRSDPKEAEAVKTGRLVKVHINSSGDVDLNGEFVSDSELNKSIKKNALKFAQEQI